MKNRTTEFRRAKRQAVINRKKKIIKEQGNYWNYKYEGTLSKGKIHCSCWMCRRKFYQSAAMTDVKKALDSIDELVDAGLGSDLINHIVRRTKSEAKKSIKGLNKTRK